MNTRPALVLAFAIALAAFIILPALLGSPFPPYELMHWADVFDLLTPLVVIPLYWLLLRSTTASSLGNRQVLSFLVLAALWVEGQGMHLAANSISNLLGDGSTEVHDLVHFYDEALSHYVWHIAMAGLSVLLVLAVRGAVGSVRWPVIAPAAVLYGLTYFLAINEGGTVPFGLPAAGLITLGLVISKRQRARTHNLIAFFLTGYAIALAFFLGWFVYWGGFPEFSEVGLI
jgi:hypothetical protein